MNFGQNNWLFTAIEAFLWGSIAWKHYIIQELVSLDGCDTKNVTFKWFFVKKLAKNNEILMKKGADFGAIERCHRKAIAGQNALCRGGGN